MAVYQNLIDDIREIISQGRDTAYQAASAAQVLTNWHVGKRIVQQEQHGADRAEYGTKLIDMLSDQLTMEFGAGYSRRNLQYYRKFYLFFPDLEIVNACVRNLTWTHFRSLLRITDESARLWYMREASEEGWSSRTLDRNISTQYYHRLLRAPDKKAIQEEMCQKAASVQTDRFELIKNPTIGILLCTETDADIARYSVLHDNDRLFMSKYLTYLPTKE